jgi:hypothetical protein
MTLIPHGCMILAVMATLIGGCAGQINGVGRSVSTEPGTIVIRNRTAMSIREVNLCRAGAHRGDALAVISPVPAMSEQIFIRRTDRTPLPRQVTVIWEDARRQTHKQDVSLAEPLKASTGGPGETLIIEIGRDSVTVALGYTPGPVPW